MRSLIKGNLLTAISMTIATTVLLGIVYPLIMTAIAQLIFPKQANGQLIERAGHIVGSSILAQGFTSAEYFHPRLSYAGNGYDAGNSNGSQLGPTNRKLIDRVRVDVASAQQENPGTPVPIDLVTGSASGLDPHITPASAEFQLPRVAKARGVRIEEVRAILEKHIEGRQFGFLGERRVNVLELNLDLDQHFPLGKPGKGQQKQAL